LQKISAFRIFRASRVFEALFNSSFRFKQDNQLSRKNGRRFESFGDCSGQTYLLVAKASGVDALRPHPVLRYVEVAAGYRARGYCDAGGRLVEVVTRSLYAGVSPNMSKLLRQTVLRQSHGAAQAVAATLLEYVQVPGIAVLGRIGLDDYRENGCAA
jgi:hypothetical protein